MTTKNEIKNVVKEFNSLCKANRFNDAGKLASENKNKFIAMIKCGGVSSLDYAYRVCSIFNMRQTDCFNIVF